jgi:hypothetical protein
MVLALILATRDVLPQPEESPLDSRLATSRLLSTHHSDRDKVKVPPLVDILTHHLASYAHVRPETQERLPPHLWSRLRVTVPFYYHHQLPEMSSVRSERKRTPKSCRIMYLTTATLIMVPDNLVDQWDREINKHVSCPLQKLVLDRKAKEIPRAQELASLYDVRAFQNGR